MKVNLWEKQIIAIQLTNRIKYQKFKINIVLKKFIDTEDRLVVARGGGGAAKWVKVVKSCKLPVIK